MSPLSPLPPLTTTILGTQPSINNCLIVQYEAQYNGYDTKRFVLTGPTQTADAAVQADATKWQTFIDSFLPPKP